MAENAQDFDPGITTDIAEIRGSSACSVRHSTSNIVEELTAYGMTGDQYRVEAQIGEGGMATIYKVSHMGLKRPAVMKVIRTRIMNDPDLLARFIEEARITSQLEHPNIIPVNDIGVLNNERIFFTMKFIEGEELEQILRRLRSDDDAYTAKYNLFALLSIFRKICDACAFAHSKGILHRDIKPDNIMVGSYGEVLLMDWGVASRENQASNLADDDDENSVSSSLTAIESLDADDEFIRATPAYMSPEQARGDAHRIDRRTDVFLLGATLYALATLNEPYAGDSINEILDYAQNCNYIPPEQRAPEREIPEDLCKIINRAMSLAAEDRYQSVAELCVDIDALLKGHAISVQRVFKSGRYLINEGEIGTEAYVIVEGMVEVFKTVNNARVPLVTLSNGDCVGELALISPAPRSASVVAVADTEVIVINKDIIKQGFGKLPPWMARAIQSLVDRLRDVTSDVNYLAGNKHLHQVMSQMRLLYPFLCEFSTDAETNVPFLVVDSHRMINEISHNLSLPVERITLQVNRLVEIGIVDVVDEQYITIPSYPIFYRFVDFVSGKHDLQSEVDVVRDPRFLASDAEFVMSLTGDIEAAAAADLVEIAPVHTGELVGHSGTDELEKTFELLFFRLQDLSSFEASDD